MQDTIATSALWHPESVTIGRASFFAAYAREFGTPTQRQVDGLMILLDEAQLRMRPKSPAFVAWNLFDVAYILATVKHETAGTYHTIDRPPAVYASNALITTHEAASRVFDDMAFGFSYVDYEVHPNGNPQRMLITYLHTEKPDYVGARAIVEGDSPAYALIVARDAEAFERMLREAMPIGGTLS